jgi:hypothetical protein
MISGKSTGSTRARHVRYGYVAVNRDVDRVGDEGARETQMKRLRSKKVMAAGAAGLCAFGIVSSRLAFADPSASDKSMATQLFKEGRALLDAGRVGPACRKLEESQRLDPGGGTLLNVALCHEREGLTATAWAEFTEALGIAKHDDRPQRIEFARAHIAQLEPELSRLTIQVPPTADAPDLEIKRDGSIIGRAARDSAIPVDPGDHVVEASASGKITWRQTVVVGSHGDTKTVVIPSLDEAPGDVATGTPAAPAAGATSDEERRGAGPSARVSPERTLPEASPGRPVGLTIGAWSAIGLGVAAAGVGTYFGLHAMALKDDADRECPNNLCSAQGSAHSRDAIHSGDAATVAFAIGGGGLVIGTVLFLVGYPTSRGATGATAKFSDLRVTSLGISTESGHPRLTLSGQW